MQHDDPIVSRIVRIERHLHVYRIAFVVSLLLLAFTVSSNVVGSQGASDVLRLKGLIIEDKEGRPRIVMGAPIPTVPARKRSDELFGIVYLGENGADRLTIGDQPNPMTADGIKPRRVGGTGILIHDREGIERGGYGVLDDEGAGLTLDWPKSGEAVVMSSNKQFSGIGLFHRSKVGVYREALTAGVIADDEQSFLKITDTTDTQRLRIQTNGIGEPQLKIFDKDGKEVSSKPIH